MQYDQPTPTEELVDEVARNPRTAEVLSAIEAILNTDEREDVPVGTWDGEGEVTTPENQQPDLVVITPDAEAGDEISFRPGELPSDVLGAAVTVWDTDADVTATYTGSIERVIVAGNGDDVITVVSDENTTVAAGDGDDTVVTASGDDSVSTGTGDDSVSTGTGNDTILSGHGADTVDGGEGYDVVQLNGVLNNYDVSVEDGDIVLVNRADENDSLRATNVEFIEFSNGTSLSIARDEDEAAVLRLYQGLLDRSADREGAQFWIENDLNGNGLSVVDIAESFLASDEAETLGLNNLTDDEFIARMYETTHGRVAAESEVAYWADTIVNGSSRAEVAAQIVGSPEAGEAVVHVKLIDGTV